MIETKIRYFDSADESLPALVLQQTCLVDSYMLWIGTTDKRPEEAELVPASGNLCVDWACAMPPPASVCPISVHQPWVPLLMFA